MAGAGAACNDDLLFRYGEKKKRISKKNMRMDRAGPVQSDCRAATNEKPLPVKHA